jgi:hypothetical protein
MRAIYDANVLYNASVRDLCLWLAVEGAVEARWTDKIHQEWTQRLAEHRPDLGVERIQRLRQTIDTAIPDCLVTGYETAIDQLELPDPDDRHVVAAAITCSADTIVTFNMNDFPASVLAPYRLEALRPDEFVNRLITLVPQAVCRAALRHRANLRRPAMTVETYLETLRSRGLPDTANRLPEICSTL